MNERMTGRARRRQAWRRLPLIAVLAAALGGCSLGRTSPPAQLFDLGPAPAASAAQDGDGRALASAAAAGTSSTGSPMAAPGAAADTPRQALAVSFSAAQMLTDTGVIWRVGDSSSPHSYATYRWAAPPSQLVQQRVVDRLSAAGPVVQDGVDPRAPLLQVTLTRFEQVYAPDGKSSSGQVAMQAVLLRDHRVVASVQLARGAPAPSLDAQGGVLALRAATDAAASDLAAWVQRSLSAPSAAAGLTSRSSP
ncbi:ABC-type transport auxiliary lipoprotein family protein [Bordetella bronchialis]|uniref:ABC-type transport auxiliary lipoprotein family protein n=1 Tax=Bordetella bronchialis TaxID=463025 RepID=UPI003D076AC4